MWVVATSQEPAVRGQESQLEYEAQIANKTVGVFTCAPDCAVGAVQSQLHMVPVAAASQLVPAITTAT